MEFMARGSRLGGEAAPRCRDATLPSADSLPPPPIWAGVDIDPPLRGRSWGSVSPFCFRVAGR